MSSIDKSYHKSAVDLKKLGLIDYDLRSRLSTGQKARITVLKQTYGHALKYPGLFHVAKVGNERANELRAAGFKVTPTNRAVIPLNEFKSATIKKGAIEFRSGRMTEKVILAGSKDFHKKAFEVSQKKLKKNQLLTARVGNSEIFKQKFTSYKDLYKYVQHVFVANDPGESTARIRGLMSIVTLENYKPLNTQGKNVKKRKAKRRKK